jgi:type I restriction enzyme R subunit
MCKHDLACEPQEVYNLRGDAAKIAFIKNFKEIQRLKTQLDQYTDIDKRQQAEIEAILPKEKLLEFRCSYIETAKQLRTIQQKKATKHHPIFSNLILSLYFLLPQLLITITS